MTGIALPRVPGSADAIGCPRVLGGNQTVRGSGRVRGTAHAVCWYGDYAPERRAVSLGALASRKRSPQRRAA